jgi:hypothetical protein
VVEKVFEHWQQAMQTIVQSQQEMFRKWVGLWTGMPLLPIARGEEGQKFQQQWHQTIAELLDKQRELLETQFRAGLRNIEEMFRQPAVADPEEFRATKRKTV